MATAAADEDDIDAESLQAQIDMSMAFTQNLVSSWMSSSQGKLPASSSTGNEEKELEEYMRRPPRLGVGAAVPESTTTFGRDAARLKSKLMGKKRSRIESQEAVVVPSDDEEESRARVVKKKARVDVFGQQGKGKKGRKDGGSAPGSSHEQGATATEKGVETSKAAGKRIPDQDIHASPKGKKNKKRHSLNQPMIDLTGSPSSPIKGHSLPSASASANCSRDDVTVATGTASDGDQKAASGHPPSVKDMDRNISETNYPPQSSSYITPKPHSKPVSKTVAPLLNLRGPPEEVEDTAPASPKKKRRRKKKKKKSIAEVAVEEDASASDD